MTNQQSPLTRRGFLAGAGVILTSLAGCAAPSPADLRQAVEEEGSLHSPQQRIAISEDTVFTADFGRTHPALVNSIETHAPELENVGDHQAKILLAVWAQGRSQLNDKYFSSRGHQGQRVGIFGLSVPEIETGLYTPVGLTEVEQAFDVETSTRAAVQILNGMVECGDQDEISVLTNLPAMNTSTGTDDTVLYTWQSAFNTLVSKRFLDGPMLQLDRNSCISQV